MAFLVGSKVRLTVGGPPMVVEGVAPSGQLRCVWFDGNTPMDGLFEPTSLERVRDDVMPLADACPPQRSAKVYGFG
jgi:uncharacterized protein YodC (DUF2158 family)